MVDLDKLYKVFLLLLESMEETCPTKAQEHNFSKSLEESEISELSRQAFLQYLLWFKGYINLRKYRFYKLPGDEEIEHYSAGDFFLEQPLELSYPPKPFLDR